MSRYLFDASSITNLVKRGVTKVLAEGKTLDLAYYESLNAVWKEHTLLRKINGETALEYIETLSLVFKALEVDSIRDEEVKVFKLASREGLTIYDASYLYIAIRDGLTLVTDDNKLKNKASQHVMALTTKELLEKETP